MGKVDGLTISICLYFYSGDISRFNGKYMMPYDALGFDIDS